MIALADRITNLTNRMHQLSFDRTENNAALIQTHSCAVTMWNIAVAMKTGGQQGGTTYNAKCKSVCLMISSIIADCLKITYRYFKWYITLKQVRNNYAQLFN